MGNDAFARWLNKRILGDYPGFNGWTELEQANHDAEVKGVFFRSPKYIDVNDPYNTAEYIGGGNPLFVFKGILYNISIFDEPVTIRIGEEFPVTFHTGNL